MFVYHGCKLCTVDSGGNIESEEIVEFSFCPSKSNIA